jgi:hypothetical protein
MAAIVTIRNHKGDLEVHIAGCADVAKTLKQTRDAAPETFEGLNLLAAIRAADVDWADAFGNEVYSDDQDNGESWTVSIMGWAPCFSSAVKAARIVFGDKGEPGYADAAVSGDLIAQPKHSAKTLATIAGGFCECGCGGSPKGKRSRFLPGHDARMHGAAKAPARALASSPTDA